MSARSFSSPDFSAFSSLSPRFRILKIRLRFSPPSLLSRFSMSSMAGVEMREKPASSYVVRITLCR